MPRLLSAVITLALLVLAPQARATDSADEAALKALDQEYAAAWLAGDADRVINLFTDDAVLVPHHGDMPVVGRDAIRQFWFDPAYSPTVIVEWTRTPAEVVVRKDTAFVRGRARLVWEYEGTRTTIPAGNYVMIAVRDAARWRIRWLTWNDDPRQWVQVTQPGH